MNRLISTYRPLFCLFLLLLLAACTAVDLCEDPITVHPHRAAIRARFNWEDANTGENSDEIPENIYFIASRPVNTWRTYGVVDTSKDPYTEDNIIRKLSTGDVLPETRADGDETPDDDNNGTTDGEGTTTPDEGEEVTPEIPAVPNPWEDPDYFYLRGGVYNLIVINDQNVNLDNTLPEEEEPELPAGSTDTDTGDTEDTGTGDAGDTETGDAGDSSTEEAEEVPLRSVLIIDGLEDYILDKRKMITDLYLNVKNMGVGKKPSVVMDNDLPDFNPNYEYLEDITTPIYYGIRRDYEVETDKPHIIDFDMTRISQSVNLYLKIRVDADVIIDKPIVELSGVCARYNIYDAHLDTTKLYRTARYAEPPVKITENATYTDYQVEVKFHTLGIAPSPNKSYLNGSGVIQVAIHAHAIQRDDNDEIIYNADGTPKTESRFVYAGINPYDELHAAKLIEIRDGKTYMRYSKEDINIHIRKLLHIEHRHIVEDNGNTGWIPADPADPDGDIKVEI